VTNNTLSLQDWANGRRRDDLQKGSRQRGERPVPPVTNSAIRAAIGFIIVIAAAALW
jgi:mRNA-degrading endonuclease toxin of MazEF toxin-antitoxin module